MEENEFWRVLEARINSELAQFGGEGYRWLTCDGLVPENDEYRDGGVYVVGRAWMMTRTASQDKWEFTLLIGGPESSRANTEWATLLPTEDETEWLAVRDWGLEIVPPAVECFSS